VRQLQRVCTEAACGYQVSQVSSEVREMALGLQDERPKLKKMRIPPAVGRLVVAHLDRLTRTDYAFMATLVEHHCRRVEAIYPSSETGEREDVVADVVAVLTSMAARISGKWNSQRHAERSRACVEHVIQSEDI